MCHPPGEFGNIPTMLLATGPFQPPYCDGSVAAAAWQRGCPSQSRRASRLQEHPARERDTSLIRRNARWMTSTSCRTRARPRRWPARSKTASANDRRGRPPAKAHEASRQPEDVHNDRHTRQRAGDEDSLFRCEQRSRAHWNQRLEDEIGHERQRRGDGQGHQSADAESTPARDQAEDQEG